MMSAGRTDGFIEVTLDTQYAGDVDIEYLACTQVKIALPLLSSMPNPREAWDPGEYRPRCSGSGGDQGIHYWTAIGEFGVNSFNYWKY